MKVKLTYFEKDIKDNTVYKDGKPVTGTSTASLPLRMGFGSYNEPRKVFGCGGLNVDDLLSVEEIPDNEVEQLKNKLLDVGLKHDNLLNEIEDLQGKLTNAVQIIKDITTKDENHRTFDYDDVQVFLNRIS